MSKCSHTVYNERYIHISSLSDQVEEFSNRKVQLQSNPAVTLPGNLLNRQNGSGRDGQRQTAICKVQRCALHYSSRFSEVGASEAHTSLQPVSNYRSRSGAFLTAAFHTRQKLPREHVQLAVRWLAKCGRKYRKTGMSFSI